MKKRRYEIQVLVTATVEVDERVFEETLTEEWRKTFYPLLNREEVVEHVAYNLLRGSELSTLDGFAHFRDDDVSVRDVEYVEWGVEEVAKKAKKTQVEKTQVEVVAFANKSIGKNLRAAREHASLSVADLASKIGADPDEVRGVEKGSLDVRESWVRAVLKACGLPNDWTAPRPTPKKRGR